MTFFKNMLFGCTLIPLVVSTASADNHMNSMKDHNNGIKEPARILEPMSSLSEKRAIRKKITKPTKGGDEGHVNKMIHYSATSGSHNPHNSKIFTQMEEVEASVIELNPVRPTPHRPSITHDWAEAKKDIDKQIKR